MKVGIVGSGVVGQTLGAKLVERGEDGVRLRLDAEPATQISFLFICSTAFAAARAVSAM
jgi:ketopantoate reductase